MLGTACREYYYVPLFYKYNWERKEERERERERRRREREQREKEKQMTYHQNRGCTDPGNCQVAVYIHVETGKKDTINILKTAAVFSD